jgi:tetratricopeptide (TPR) repeat protein
VTISGLQGLGGIGKTTLALKLAEQLTPRYPDAQFYLDLQGASPQPLAATDALAHVIRAYHPTAKLPAAEPALRAFYLSVLHEQRALLLLDNAAGRKQVEPLIPPASCALLITSRQHFKLPGQHLQSLDKLSPADARRLLLAIEPRTGAHADALAKLCACLPLALRLAASALAERVDLSVTDYVRRLTDTQQRLKLLDGVEASLSLSYDLLSAELQQCWRTLAVFPITFAAPAAAAVWAVTEDEAQDALGELVKYSLLDWDATDARYSLHDLAHLFAEKCLSATERHTGQTRHAAYYMDVLAQANELYKQGGAALMRGLALFDAEWSNIQAGQAWVALGAGDEPALARLCAHYPDAGPYVLHLRQSPRERINWLTTSLAAARGLHHRRTEANHLGNMGLAYIDLGEPRQAITVNEQVLAIMRELGDRRSEGSVLGNIGFAYANLGETERAIEFYDQHLAIAREIGDRLGEGNALGNLGLAYANLGEPRRALAFHEQDLTIAREIGDRRGETDALGNLGLAYADLGETHRAVEFYEQALAIAREIGDQRGEGNVLWHMSLAYAALGDRQQAIALAAAALEIFEQIEDTHADKVREKLTEWRGEAE